MRLKTVTMGWVLALGLMGLAGGVQAALIDRGNGMIYDSLQNITWTQNANLAATERFGIETTTGGGNGIRADGRMNWGTAQAWIAGMNAANYGGYSDWRLWSALNADSSGPCLGHNCSGSELGHLFYVDGGFSAFQSIKSSTVLTNVFTNLQSDYYWSGTEFSSGRAWHFYTNGGYQISTLKGYQSYAWAVRSGDVAAVPLPAAVWLFGSGLAGLLAVPSWRRRRLGSLK